MSGDHACACVIIADSIQTHELHPSLPVAHVPEIRMPPLKFSLGPGRPHAVVVDVVGREVVGDLAAGGGQQRMQVPAPAVDLGNVGAGKFARFRLIPSHHLGAGSKNDLTPLAQGRDGFFRNDRFQSRPYNQQ